MTETGTNSVAPVVIWGAVLSLTGGVRPRAMVLQTRGTADITEWAATWITDDLVGHVVASKGEERWNAFSVGSRADSLQAWARPLTDVQRVALTDVSATRASTMGPRQNEWYWSAGVLLEFEGGDTLPLPPFDPDGTRYVDTDVLSEQVNDFLQVATTALASRRRQEH